MEYWTDQQLSSIDKMLNPRSIAVVGATDRMQYGGRFLRSALSAGDRVRVYPVNPRYDELMGLQCYPSVTDLPESPDLVGIIVPYHRVIPVLRESVDKGAGSAIVISAGFSERWEEDRRLLQNELGRLALESGVRVSGPNCLGLANVKAGVWPCSSSSTVFEKLETGNIGLVCQSGASAFGPFLSRAIGRGVGYSYIVSTGNEADLEASDFARYLLDDDDTKVIAMFVEGFKNARKFLEVARLAAKKGKPIVLIKIGRSDLGARAAGYHTASSTGVDAVYEGAFKQHGVTRVADWDQLLEVSQMLADNPAPSPPGIAVMSHSGGVCSLTADALGAEGLELPDLSAEAQHAIGQILDGFGWAGNPADITGHASRDTVELIMEHLISQPQVSALVVASSASDEQVQHVVDVADRHDKTVAYLHTGNELGAPTGVDALKRARIPVFYSPENLASAFRKLHDYHDWRLRTLDGGFGAAQVMSGPQRSIAHELRTLGSRTLTADEAKRVLGGWGVAVIRYLRVSTVEEAAAAAADRIGYPVALKVEPRSADENTPDSGEIVATDLTGTCRAYEEVLRSAILGSWSTEVPVVLVREMAPGGTEVAVRVKRDQQLGAVLTFGMGGLFAEAMAHVSLRICPISSQDARDMVDEAAGSRILTGLNGRPRGDVNSLIDTLLRISDLAVNLEGVVDEIDIDPLIVLPEGVGVKALYTSITVKDQR